MIENLSLLILAAGKGSRYGGQKQIDAIDKEGHSLMDFAIFDALKVGIRHFVLIVNNDFPEERKEEWSRRMQSYHAKIDFVLQDFQSLPEKYLTVLNEREKPLGTAHAVWCAKNYIEGAFITMNADDYYGPQAFAKIVNFYQQYPHQNAILSFQLKQTLSEYGGVSRGICHVESNLLLSVEEYVKIERNEEGIKGYNMNMEEEFIDDNSLVSMNLWLLQNELFEFIEEDLEEFLTDYEDHQTEIYLPFVINRLLLNGLASFNLLTTEEKWYGLTYKEDKIHVQTFIQMMKSQSVYPKSLWHE